jgi:hypothetical protein
MNWKSKSYLLKKSSESKTEVKLESVSSLIFQGFKKKRYVLSDPPNLLNSALRQFFSPVMYNPTHSV